MDPSGLVPCSPPTMPPAQGGSSSCETRHLAYCDAAKSTGLRFNNCACRVSALVCKIINDPGRSDEMRRCMNCINACMFEHWKNRDTDPWRQATKLCSDPHTSAFACCSAMVSAEQQGLTECKNNKCKALCTGRGRLMPPANSGEQRRIHLGTNLCCTKKGQGGPGDPV